MRKFQKPIRKFAYTNFSPVKKTGNFSRGNYSYKNSSGNNKISDFFNSLFVSNIYFQILGILVVTAGVLILFENYKNTELEKIIAGNSNQSAIVDNKTNLVPNFELSTFESREKNLKSFVVDYQRPVESPQIAGSNNQENQDKNTQNQSAKNTVSSTNSSN